MRIFGMAAILVALAATPALRADPAPAATVQALPWMETTIGRLKAELIAKYGLAQTARIERGLAQTARLWRPEDGSASDYEGFVRSQFAGDPKALDGLFSRMEFVMESLEGRVLEVNRDFRWYSDLDLGPLLPVDDLLGGFDAGAHIVDDCFANKLAFTVLLNFPVMSLQQQLQDGPGWSTRQWAEVRLTERFAKRIPASVNQAVAEATSQGEAYIAGYNIWMHHLVDAKGQRLFPAKLRLLSHWNLRDEIKSRYAQGKDGLPAQREIQKVMERIVTQTIPAVVIDNPNVDWNPFSNQVTPAAVKDSDQPAPALKISSDPEPDTRYQVLFNCYKAVRQMDPYSPTTPSHIARSYEDARQIPEARVLGMLQEICNSPLVKQVAKVIQTDLGRKLEPFDVWYNGFRPGSNLDQAKLDAIVRQRFPTAAAYKKEMPKLLMDLGFKPEMARLLADNIEVDPARGSGHAMQSGRRGDHPHLRTRVGQDGMDYKGFNIAIHENGHNVEQTFSMNFVDHTLMSGVPNNAFTEALAFVFQARDLELLGQPAPNAREKAMAVLNDFWGAYEIAGVGMVDTAVWHWMYAHPEARPAELREATLAISKDIWNRYYASVFGQKDCVLLGIYSHMIDSLLYLPDYPLGHMIAFQIQRQIDQTGKLGEEFQRMASLGRLTPDLWMIRATGKPVAPDALLEATAAALKDLAK